MTAINRSLQMEQVQKKALVQLFEKLSDYENILKNSNIVNILSDIENKLENCRTISNNNILLNDTELMHEIMMDLHIFTAINTILYDQDKIEQVKMIQQNALEVFKRKNKDYGDAFARYGVIGILIRIEDKIQRCKSICKNNEIMVNDESFQDTILDLHNYSAMALMLLDNDF